MILFSLIIEIWTKQRFGFMWLIDLCWKRFVQSENTSHFWVAKNQLTYIFIEMVPKVSAGIKSCVRGFYNERNPGSWSGVWLWLLCCAAMWKRLSQVQLSDPTTPSLFLSFLPDPYIIAIHIQANHIRARARSSPSLGVCPFWRKWIACSMLQVQVLGDVSFLLSQMTH